MLRTRIIQLLGTLLGIQLFSFASNCFAIQEQQSKENQSQKLQANHPVIPGLVSSNLDDNIEGRILIGELNCIACHDTQLDEWTKITKTAPRLSQVGQRVNPYYLESFIRSPHVMKPGTTMPDLLSSLDAKEKAETAKSIAHFLVSIQKSEFRLEVPDQVAAESGEQLFHSVGCVACHSPRDGDGTEQMRNSSAPLGDLEKKYNVTSLTNFLADPHRVRPGGRMPNLNLARRDYQRLANYLLKKTRLPGRLNYTLIKGRVWEGLDVNVDRIQAGHVDDFDLQKIKNISQNSAVVYEGFLQNTMEGEASFFLEWNGGELWINDKKVVELKPSSRRGVKKSVGKSVLVSGWNKLKLVYIHAGKDPKLSLQWMAPGKISAPIASSQLSVSSEPIPDYKPLIPDPELVRRGGQAFVQYGCANCHDDVEKKVEGQFSFTKPSSLESANTAKGCLGEATGRWPKYSLSDKQVQSIRVAWKQVDRKLEQPIHEVNRSLVTFNCIACHDRADLGGVTPERNSLFTGSNNELGNDGRIPPPLTHVGAKLPKDWMREVLFRGQRQRDYMATTMPQFGENNIGHLVDLFEKVDSIEPVNFEKIDNRQQVKQAGHLLIGTKGFSCIACHDFNGQKAAGPGAMDIIHATSRLKKDWFYWFMLKPNRFRKGTIMPASWPGGHVFMEDVLDGDAKKQIESLWVYLEDGIRAKNPEGLSRKSPELRVTDEALICRGRGTAGYRGMGVGYPERVSLAFDTQEMSLRLLWKGEFATVDNGRFFARGNDRIAFPAGIPFHRLESLDDNWPYKRKTDYLFPQDQGYRFEGYSLDKMKRPTLMYRYGDIQVKDFFVDLLDEKKNAFFKRTLTLQTPVDQEEFYFRVAAGKSIKKVNQNEYQVDRLKIRFEGADESLIREGTPEELLLKLKIPKGTTVITLEYQW